MKQGISSCAFFFGTKVALCTSLFLHRGFSVSSAGGTCLSGHVGVTLQCGCSADSPSQLRQMGRSSLVWLKPYGQRWSSGGVGAGNSQIWVFNFPEAGL